MRLVERQPQILHFAQDDNSECRWNVVNSDTTLEGATRHFVMRENSVFGDLKRRPCPFSKSFFVL
jgi:hypothetical protein